MAAPVGDPSAVEEQHLVGQPDRGLAVGDQHQRGPEPDETVDRMAARIRASTSGSTAEVASSRISSRGRRTRARASDSRCRWPPDSVVPRSPSRESRPCRQRCDEPVGLGGAQRRPHVLVRHVLAEGDVAAHGVVEHEGRLGHQRHVPSQLAGREVTQVGAVEEDPAVVGVDQPGQQRGQRALPRGRLADDRDRAPRFDVEAELVERVAGRRRRSSASPSSSRVAARLGEVAAACRRTPCATGSSSTRCTRRKPTTERGNSPSSQPIDRIGNATIVSR